MQEHEQVDRQEFLREAKMYNKWDQLYPALLHLCVMFIMRYVVPTWTSLAAIVNRIMMLFGTIF
jgi:hypothetical protein